MLGLVYGWLLLVAVTNAVLMRRPRGSASVAFEVMVPARDEAARLPLLLPQLIAADCRVSVYDDGSSDGTGDLAAQLGAEVVVGGELPLGWRGKTNACHQLAERASAEWVVFLDADTRPAPEFVPALSAFLTSRPSHVKVVTGFPTVLPGRGLEPAYLFWVPYILLATNPFGLVARSGLGHNFFLNGQVTAWRSATLREIRPFEAARDAVLDDVTIGRLLARRRVGVEVADLSQVLAVQMYTDWHEAVEGMSKNASDVVPGRFGGYLFAMLLLAVGWLWVLVPPFGLALLAAAICVNMVVKMPWWAPLLTPLSLTLGAWTAVRSVLNRRRGLVSWKGRRI